ncbi:hypersensitive-induced response protein 4-like [Cucurbita maxima]|uniref:Hypersensitive-induced response protein 4-like n=1 Tax=Cucurbita maxima TaxID=3661 RepID=A0A6J1I1X6_CUCMA|nr:hypersensitive-induced response protein 4-like [Cucurbita maxima]
MSTLAPYNRQPQNRLTRKRFTHHKSLEGGTNSNLGVVEKWGRFQMSAQPGFRFINPFSGKYRAGILSTRIRSLDVRVETKTKDNVFVQLVCSIRFRIVEANAMMHFMNCKIPKHRLVRALVLRMNLDEENETLFLRMWKTLPQLLVLKP